jgi:phospholipid transport system substrate-binding protein
MLPEALAIPPGPRYFIEGLGIATKKTARSCPTPLSLEHDLTDRPAFPWNDHRSVNGARHIRPSRRATLAALAAAFIAISWPVGATDAGTEGKAFIENLAEQAIAALTAPGTSRDEREARARALLADNFAVPTIGQFVLGRYWRTATPEQREEYLRLFEELIVVTYVDRFSRYSGERLRVSNAVVDQESRDILVYSEITRPAGGPVQVAWRVRRTPPSFKIVDVLVEGVSMGQTQRSDFASVIRNNGGALSALLEEIRRRVRQPA